MKCEKCNHKQAKHFGFENDCQIPTCSCKESRKDQLKEGYRRMARRDKKVSEEMLNASEEALE